MIEEYQSRDLIPGSNLAHLGIPNFAFLIEQSVSLVGVRAQRRTLLPLLLQVESLSGRRLELALVAMRLLAMQSEMVATMDVNLVGVDFSMASRFGDFS